MGYDPQKHHRRSIRLPGYDYSNCGAYFVTICTRNSEMILTNDVKSVGVALAATPGLESRLESRTALEIDPAKRFELTAIGEIVDKNWRELPNRFPAVTLNEYVIMPNHFHGIVFINSVDQLRTNDERHGVADDSRHGVADDSRQGVAARATPTLGTITELL